MIRIGTAILEIVVAAENCVILRGTERGVSQCNQDLWAIPRSGLTPQAQDTVDTWEELAYEQRAD